MDDVKFSDLIGKTLVSVANNDNEEIVFTSDDGSRYRLYHYQDCCESVTVEDIIGDLDDLVGSPILMAEEATSENKTPEGLTDKGDGEWQPEKMAETACFMLPDW